MRATHAAKILLVDNEPVVRGNLARMLEECGHSCTECTGGAEAYIRLRRERFDVVVSDVQIPQINGLDLLDMVSALRDRPEMVLTSNLTNARWVRHAFRRGAHDVLPKPFDIQELRQVIENALTQRRSVRQSNEKPARSAGSAHTRRRDIESSLALVAAVEAKEPHAKGHANMVSRFCEVIARHMEVPSSQVETLKIAALLHDVGKTGVPDAILRKRGPLTSDEFKLIKKHPVTAMDILAQSTSLHHELPYILHHHERYDGAGYPAELAGEDIPLGARILNVGDSLAVMLSTRSYKAAFTVDRVKTELARCAGKQFDPAVARAALQGLEKESGPLFAP